jgi:hypothetical protein
MELKTNKVDVREQLAKTIPRLYRDRVFSALRMAAPRLSSARQQ